MRIPAALALCLVLTACGDKADEDDERTAGGQVLEGTISDSMLPLDTVRSQPPLAKATGAAGEGGSEPDAEATDAAADEGDAAPDAAAAPATDEEG